jgi:hypothetical protein
MVPAWAKAEPGVDPNSFTNQLATILHKSFGIEPRGRGCVYQKPYPDYYDQLNKYSFPTNMNMVELNGKKVLVQPS